MCCVRLFLALLSLYAVVLFAHADPLLSDLTTLPQGKDAREDSQEDELSSYQQRAQQFNLSAHPYWHLLLRLSDNRSDVQDASFFFSIPSTSTDAFLVDAGKELAHFLRALLLSPLNQSHPLCLFPLRSRWLIKKLALPTTHFSSLSCLKLDKFMNRYLSDKIAVVFIDERVNTLPNMMGHIGLRLYANTSSSSDQVVSYVTILHTLNPLSMLYDALIEGGEGRLNIYDLKQTLAYYLEDEKRSVWQYDMPLHRQQMETILLQLWELAGRQSRYAYLSYNCLTPLIELLQVADSTFNRTWKSAQQQRLKGWHSPLEFIQFLADHQYFTHHEPTAIYLSDADRQWAETTKTEVDMPADKDNNSTARGTKTALTIRNQQVNLLNKAKTSRLSLGLSHRADDASENEQQSFFDLSFDVYGSLLSDNHRTDFTEYELRVLGADITIPATKNSPILQELALYSVKYLPTFNGDLSSLSWQVSAGGTNDDPSFVPQLLGGIGLAYRLNHNLFLWGLLNADYIWQESANDQRHSNAFIIDNELGIIIDFSLWGEVFKSSFYVWSYIHEDRPNLPRFKWVFNWRVNRDYALNFNILTKTPRHATRHTDNVVGTLSVSRYF